MYVGNPGEIDFGSSSREVRVSEGSSCQESTVVNTVNKRHGPGHGKIMEVGKQEKKPSCQGSNSHLSTNKNFATLP